MRAGDIAAYAYGFPLGRIRFAEKEPTSRFDFVATLPQGSREALQRVLKAKLGLVGRRETENMDVLLLEVNRANTPGLKPPVLEKNDTYWATGVFHSSDEVLTRALRVLTAWRTIWNVTSRCRSLIKLASHNISA